MLRYIMKNTSTTRPLVAASPPTAPCTHRGRLPARTEPRAMLPREPDSLAKPISAAILRIRTAPAKDMEPLRSTWRPSWVPKVSAKCGSVGRTLRLGFIPPAPALELTLRDAPSHDLFHREPSPPAAGDPDGTNLHVTAPPGARIVSERTLVGPIRAGRWP